MKSIQPQSVKTVDIIKGTIQPIIFFLQLVYKNGYQRAYVKPTCLTAEHPSGKINIHANTGRLYFISN
jgi:hypothetical protein